MTLYSVLQVAFWTCVIERQTDKNWVGKKPPVKDARMLMVCSRSDLSDNLFCEEREICIKLV